MWRVLAIILSIVSSMTAEPLKQGERDRAMSYLHATRKQFLDIVTTVTAEQLRFKPAANRWSIAEIAEHLTLVEDSVYEAAQTALLRPPTEPNPGLDEKIQQGVASRARRVQAPEGFVPAGRWTTAAELAGEFKTRRDRNIEFIQTTSAEMRRHALPHPALGPLDAYQWFLFAAAHADRHIQQMREVAADPAFPKPK